MSVTLVTITLDRCILQICCVETMRACVVLLFAFLALAFVAAYAADEVSVYVSSVGGHVEFV